MSGVPEGFTYQRRKNGDVVVRHHGVEAAVLRGRQADALAAAEAGGGDVQALLARLTGNYKHGNERSAGSHPRRRG